MSRHPVNPLRNLWKPVRAVACLSLMVCDLRYHAGADDILSRLASLVATGLARATHSEVLLAKVQAPIAATAATSRCYAVTADVRQQHVCPVSCRLLPHPDRTTFCRISPSHILGPCTNSAALGVEVSVVHRVPRRHAVGVPLRHRLHGPTVV